MLAPRPGLVGLVRMCFCVWFREWERKLRCVCYLWSASGLVFNLRGCLKCRCRFSQSWIGGTRGSQVVRCTFLVWREICEYRSAEYLGLTFADVYG